MNILKNCNVIALVGACFLLFFVILLIPWSGTTRGPINPVEEIYDTTEQYIFQTSSLDPTTTETSPYERINNDVLEVSKENKTNDTYNAEDKLVHFEDNLNTDIKNEHSLTYPTFNKHQTFNYDKQAKNCLKTYNIYCNVNDKSFYYQKNSNKYEFFKEHVNLICKTNDCAIKNVDICELQISKHILRNFKHCEMPFNKRTAKYYPLLKQKSNPFDFKEKHYDAYYKPSTPSSQIYVSKTKRDEVPFNVDEDHFNNYQKLLPLESISLIDILENKTVQGIYIDDMTVFVFYKNFLYFSTKDFAYLVVRRRDGKLDIFLDELYTLQNKIGNLRVSPESIVHNSFSYKQLCQGQNSHLTNIYTIALQKLFEPFCIGRVDDIFNYNYNSKNEYKLVNKKYITIKSFESQEFRKIIIYRMKIKRK